MPDGPSILDEARRLTITDPAYGLRLCERVLADEPAADERVDALALSANLHMELVQPLDAERVARAAVGFADVEPVGNGPAARAAAALAFALTETGRLDEARQVIETALARTSGPARTPLLLESARLCFLFAETELATSRLSEGLELTPAERSPRSRARVLTARAVSLAQRGHFAESLLDLDEALDVLPGQRTSPDAAQVLATRAQLLIETDRLEAAYLDASDAVLLVGSRAGPPRRAQLNHCLASALLRAGCAEEAIPLALSAANVARDIGSAARERTSLHVVVSAYLASGRLDEARPHFERLKTIAANGHSPPLDAALRQHAAHFDLARGDPRSALAHLAGGGGAERGPPLFPEAAIVRAQALEMLGDPAGALDALAPLLAQADQPENPVRDVAMHDAAHRALAALGRHDEALEHLRRCREIDLRTRTSNTAVRLAHLRLTLAERADRQDEQQRGAARVDAIIDHTPHVAIVVADDAGRVRRWNPAAAVLFGRDYEAAPAVQLEELFDAPDLAGDNGGPIERTILRPDGSVRHALVSHFTIEAEDDTRRRVHMCVDLTERLAIVERLRASEERFAGTFRASPDAVFVVDTTAQACVNANEATSRITGWSEFELLRRGLWEREFFPGTGLLDAMLDEVAAAGFSRRSDLPCRRKNGSETFLDLTLRSVSVDGRPHVVGVGRDVTESVLSRERLEVALGEVERLRNRLQAENAYLQEEVQGSTGPVRLIGKSPPMQDLVRTISRVAPSDATVLIVGETGTGKELVARAIHASSDRRNRTLVKVNCAAIAAGLVESELFGHERGAFTGADTTREGRFALADGGSLFLDEIGELPPDAQAKLLRVLQEQEFESVGSNVSRSVDVRVIVATNRDLAAAVRSGRFRQDLYYRLNVFPIVVPPLRIRGDDIIALAEHFLVDAGRRIGRAFSGFTPDAVTALRKNRWPGNVRELQNYVQRAAILADGPWVSDIIPEAPGPTANPPHEAGSRPDAGLPPHATVGATLAEAERAHVVAALESCGWRIEGSQGAATRLGLAPSTLRSRMQRLGISRRS